MGARSEGHGQGRGYIERRGGELMEASVKAKGSAVGEGWKT